MPIDIDTELESLKERNARVELDKAWEISWTRRLFIASMTYAFACIWLFIIGNGNPFTNGIVPVVGYVLSTLSIPVMKAWWIKNKK